jgi:protein-disulfide isomerase
MRKSETFVLAAILLLALGGLAYSFTRPAAKPEPVHLEPALAMPASGLLANRHDFLGDSAAPFTLIEFGDYQCPPCRGARPQVKELLSKYKGKLKLDFRNLPLPQLHSNAMYSAIVAEAARDQHQFWAVHTALYEAVLSDLAIDSIVNAKLNVKSLSNLQMARARKAVEADQQIATKLELDSTPSFLLACPDGKLYHLNELASVSNFIK